MFLEIRNTLLRRSWTELVLQQYRLCGEDAIYLIFWIAPFHFRAGIKRVSIYASGAGRKLKCFTDWNGKEIVQASLKAARYYPSVSPTNLCEEKLIYALFFLEKLHLALIISFWNLIFSKFETFQSDFRIKRGNGVERGR